MPVWIAFAGGAMRRQYCRRIAGSMLALVVACAAPAMAQTSTGTPTGFAAAQGGGPQGTVDIRLDAKQTEAVQRVSAYFNTLKQMKGIFVQTDPDKKRTRGRFYVQKPGKFRFDYAPPSRKIMAS